jgi:hypothetical protein
MIGGGVWVVPYYGGTTAAAVVSSSWWPAFFVWVFVRSVVGGDRNSKSMTRLKMGGICDWGDLICVET